MCRKTGPWGSGAALTNSAAVVRPSALCLSLDVALVSQRLGCLQRIFCVSPSHPTPVFCVQSAVEATTESSGFALGVKAEWEPGPN